MLTCTAPLAAVQIASFVTEANDRFADNSSFVADQFDLSGVAHNGRWATMISENVYITAAHFAPVIGSSMFFYADNDPNGASESRQISSDRQQIQGTDIFVGTLDAALPSNFSFFDFATEDINFMPGGPGSFSGSSYDGANAYVLGRSPSNFLNSQDIAVGRNLLDNFASRTVTGANSGASIEATDDRPDGVPFEAMLQEGDSGAPLFVENAQGGLTIVGMNWFTGDADNDEVADFFGASYLGNYDEDIQAFIDANPVPEPANIALFLGLALGIPLFIRRRR